MAIYMPHSVLAGMDEISDDRGCIDKPKAKRLFTGSRSWIPSSGNMEVPAKSWPKEE